MYLLGVTGGIGSGKTLVCSILEKLGIPVYCADSEAKRLMNDDRDLAGGIKELLGEGAYLGSSLNSGFVAERVFGDNALLEKLNHLVHPVVRKDFAAWVNLQKNVPYVVEEAAILFESGAAGFLDGSVLVYAPVELRIKRVMERDGVDEASVRRRMSHQMDEEEKMKLADHVIYNDGDKMLLPQVIALHDILLNSK